MLIGYVYILAHRLTKLVYVGQTSRTVDCRCGSHIIKALNKTHPNIHLGRAIRKYRPEGFSVITVATICGADKRELRKRLHEAELSWYMFMSELSCELYNQEVPLASSLGYERTAITKKRISLAKTGVPSPKKGSKLTSEQKKNMYVPWGNSHRKGFPFTDEVKQKMSETRKGRPSPNKGKKASEETKERLRLSHIGNQSSRKGKTCTEEQRENMRLGWLKRKAGQVSRSVSVEESV